MEKGKFVEAIAPEEELFVESLWPVMENGYSVAEARRRTDERYQLFLIEKSENVYRRWYDPQTYPNLYQRFVKLDASNPEALLAFAHQYGLIYKSPIVVTKTRKPDVTGNFPHGIPLEEWKTEIGAMRATRELHDRLHDEAWLKERIWWDKEGRLYYMDPVMSFPIAGQPWPPKVREESLRERFQERDMTATGWYILRGMINFRLHRQISPQLRWKQNRTYDLYFTPDSLLATLWLQFAQEVTKNQRIKRCLYCKKRISGAPQKKYCSRTCITLASRERKKEEREKRAA